MLALSAQPSFAITGNQWLPLAQDSDPDANLSSFAYLAGIYHTILYSGIRNICPDTPEAIGTEQIKAIVIRWFEENPQNRHFEMPLATFNALGDAYGFVGTDDDGICPFE